MSEVSGRPVGRSRTGVGAKFLLTVGVLVLAVFAVASVAALGLDRLHRNTQSLADQRLRTVQDSADLVAATFALHETALLQIAADDAQTDASVDAELEGTLIPKFERAAEVLLQDYTGDPASARTVVHVRDGLQAYLALHAQHVTTVDSHGRETLTAAARSELAQKIDFIFGDLVDQGEALRAAEAVRADQTRRAADDAYGSTLLELAVSAVLSLLLGLAVATLLIRNLVPRIRAYSQFAAQVAAGRATADLIPRGHDELTELGVALNDMVHQRQQLAAVEQAQAEFMETLQVTGTEDEAQSLVQRHLERSLAGSSVVVLRRNNSANRLEAATSIPAGEALAERLVGAEPRSCAAIRLSRTHREGATPPLLSCTLCSLRDQPSTCEPLLVGGEVIGSVLVTSTEPPGPAEEGMVRNTVAQAAPMLANLRNLALAEFRANNDALTGLPNKRATDDTLKRMVAQASRSISPLTAIMLDLDHFKQINDRYGHGKGDEVLAAVGTTVLACLRAGDFGGRFGGEEFLLLLPESSAQTAVHVAERIRSAIESITIVGVESPITASLGIAELLQHAGTPDGLVHEADRALYTAKAEGRNRIVIATPAAAPAEVSQAR